LRTSIIASHKELPLAIHPCLRGNAGGSFKQNEHRLGSRSESSPFSGLEGMEASKNGDTDAENFDSGGPLKKKT
jgi:hypothetical protein